MRLSQTASAGDVSLRNTADATCKQEEIYTRVATEFGPSLARLAAAYEADRTHQEDLLQDIHMALWRSFATFENRCSLRTWVYRVAHNTAATYVRRQRRSGLSESVSLEELDDLPHEFDGEQQLDESIVLTRVRALVQQLKAIDHG